MKRSTLIVAVGIVVLALSLAQIWDIARRKVISEDPRVCTPVWKRHIVVRASRRAARVVERVLPSAGEARPETPTVKLPNLELTEVVSGLQAPTTLAFVPPDGFLVLEKTTGRVRHVRNGSIVGTALDLGVDSRSERGALGMVAHPSFQENRFIYIYWTSRLVDRNAIPGEDPRDAAEAIARINRVDRFVWNGTALTFDRNILILPSRVVESHSKVPETVHNGGVMVFGHDETLLVVTGDQVLRGQLQNISDGPPPTHQNLTGVILRVNDDGSVPSDNPFYKFGVEMGGEQGASLTRIFAYGIRNSFGMDADPLTGELWITENGLNTFDEVNRVPPGFNSGWVQIMGPRICFDQYRALEKPLNPEYLGESPGFRTDRLANSADEAERQLVRFTNSVYLEPGFSWKFPVAPTALHFVRAEGLGGLERHSNVLVGDYFGRLYKFVLDKERKSFHFTDRRLSDKVADNTLDHRGAETESLVIGTGFGIITDIETSPNGSLFVVSLSHGKVYEIQPE